MRRSLKTLAATLIALAQGANAIAPSNASPDALSRLESFRPTNLVNEDPALCDPFLEGWTKAFDGDGKLDESAVNFSALYPQAQVFVVPELPDWKNYSERSAYGIAVDFDGDGENEVLEFRSQYLGWRYMSVSLSLFDSEADFARANEPNRSPPRQIYEYAPLNQARILKLGTKLYTLRGPHTFERPHGRHEPTAADVVVSLVQLSATNEPHTVCTVRLLPEADAYAKVIETTSLFRAMRDVHGVGECYPGSLGWRAPPFDSALPTILYRPWTLKPDGVEDVAQRRQADILRETHYLRWGLADPQSWRDYLEVKASRRQFLRDLATYYRSTGKAASKGEAKDLAERSWRLVLDTLMYGADSFDFDLSQHKSPITPDSSPVTIVRFGIASMIATHSSDDGDAWQRVLLAAIYTRQPLETVRAIVERVDNAFEASLRAIEPSKVDYRRRKTRDQEDYWRQALIAALGHNELTKIFIERTNPGLGSNGFDKTPLMYAAQHDRLNAVRLLLEYGVAVDAVTDDTKGYDRCLELDRDHRTALMYAAENASPAVIDALLDGGASVTAADTKGNTPLWYFARNAKVTNAAERARLIKRLGG